MKSPRISTALVLVLVHVLFAGAVAAQGKSPNGLRYGKWRPQDIPQGYKVYKHGRYEIQSNCTPEVANRLGKHMKKMFKVYAKHFPYTKTPKGKMYIKLFPDRDGYRAYGGGGGAVAHYSMRHDEMVGYNTGVVGGVDVAGGTTGSGIRRSTATKMDTLGVFSHEGWHQYFHWVCGSKIAFPAWCDEGIGEYFYPTWWKNGKPVMGAPCETRLTTIQWAILNKRYVPLNEFVTYDQRRYYANPGICYAQGWAFVHFLYEHPHWKKKRYVQRYVKVFLDQHSIEKTVKRVFPKSTKWEKMDEDFRNWVMSIKPVPPLESDDPVFERLLERFEKVAGRTKEYYDQLPADVKKAIDDVMSRRRDAPKDEQPVKKNVKGS